MFKMFLILFLICGQADLPYIIEKMQDLSEYVC
jgi:hypothetical protein